MTESTHTYSAVVIGTPDIPLAIRGGSITLDDTSSPHVTATLEIGEPGEWVAVPDVVDPGTSEVTYYGGPEWVADPDTLDAIDPAQTPPPRVRLDVDAVFPSGAQSRTFDLTIRSREPVQESGQIVLQLASDEALLQDHAPLEDDETPFDIAASLRDVIDYVLNLAIPGAALEASPAVDADVTAYWELTNQWKNPAARNDATGYGIGTGTSAVARVTSPLINGLPCIRFTASGAGLAFLGTPATMSVTPGEKITASVYMASASTSRPARFLFRFTDATGATLKDVYTATTMTSTNAAAPTRLVETVTVPPGASGVIIHVNTTVNTAGQNHFVSQGMLYRDAHVVDWFDGVLAPAGYATAWEDPDAVNASGSTRYPDVERDPESLVWRAGQPGLEFLHPHVQAAGFRLVCDETRSWTLRDENYTAPGALDIRFGVNMIDGVDRIDRDAGVWTDARITVYSWQDRRTGQRQERYDVHPAPGTPYSLATRVDVDAPYPGPGRSEYAVRRAQGRRREVTATMVSDWTARAEQPVTVVLDGAPAQTGKTSRIEYDLTSDRLTVSTRTADTGSGSIDLLAGTINGLAGTINDL